MFGCQELTINIFKAVSAMSLLALLSACGSTGSPVPVHEVGTRTDDKKLTGTYSVKPGDTLYSIAWRYGVDYRQLAEINGIQAPFTIYADQQIRLTGKPLQTTTAVRPKPASVEVRPAPVAAAKVPATVSGKGQIGWQWPVEGKVIKPFSLKGNVNKGIDIGVSAGEKVRSAAGGTVVYAGGGLRGYGKLVIIKHDDQFLSAYGNNGKILVKEGEQVKAGKVIALLVEAEKSPVPMHFEIRREGKPVPPLDYLPRP